jgi:Asp-tRNA(Asn)/Glu-tRNA(Gln) amidotransferase A subunit family amidase
MGQFSKEMFAKMGFLHCSIQDIHEALLSGRLDVQTLFEYTRSRIESLESRYHAWVSIQKTLPSLAGDKTVPLWGIPVGVKDVMNTHEFSTQMGSVLWKDFQPGNDARIVFNIKQAGGFVMGKTDSAEFAVHALGPTQNPHDARYTPGTSSSGSAVAVATGMVPVALGTQSAGSIIRPASFNGVYGFKPSFGLIPRTGVLKTCDTLDTLGFFVAHAQDLRTVFDAITVKGNNYPISNALLADENEQKKLSSHGWKIGVLKGTFLDRMPSYAQERYFELVKKLSGHNSVQLEEFELPADFEKAHEIHTTIYHKSLSYYFQQEAQAQDSISSIMKFIIEHGKSITLQQYKEALEQQTRLALLLDQCMKKYDCIITLSTAGQAPLRGVVEQIDTALIWTLCGAPALSAPAFVSPQGMPFGLQVISRKYRDYRLMSCVEHLIACGFLPKSTNPLVSGFVNNSNVLHDQKEWAQV